MELNPTTFLQLGVAGLIIIVLLAFIGLIIKRTVITMGEKKDSDADKDARLSEMRADRDAWRAHAQSLQTDLREMTEASELSAKINEGILQQLQTRKKT